jgi:hypothetical protein
LTFAGEKGKQFSEREHECPRDNRRIAKLSEEERELILRKLVKLEEPFEPTPAMEDAIREGLRSVREEKTYSAAEVRARIAASTAR